MTGTILPPRTESNVALPRAPRAPDADRILAAGYELVAAFERSELRTVRPAR
jgi:hypothetical protein